jgi:hypothetical protein
MYRLSAYLYGTVKARVPAEALIIRDLNSLGYLPLPAVNYLILEKPKPEKPKPGSGLRFCDFWVQSQARRAPRTGRVLRQSCPC